MPLWISWGPVWGSNTWAFKLCGYRPLPMGSGFVTCAHGVLPVPAPATLEILKGAPVYGCDAGMELVTPTGAAIVAGMAKGYSSLPPMQVQAIGYGAGSREVEGRPNLLRMVVGTRLPGRRWMPPVPPRAPKRW
jgi:uncharacterized protein (DUF111 family)